MCSRFQVKSLIQIFLFIINSSRSFMCVGQSVQKKTCQKCYLTCVCVSCLASAGHQRLHRVDGIPVRDSDGLVLVGLAVCWGSRDSYYISLQQEQSIGKDADIHAHSLTQQPFLSFFCLVLLRFKLQSGSSTLG